MIRQAVILCGGLGTRLGSLTAAVPKPLLKIEETPFLDILIDELGRHGFNEILLLAGHLGEQIEDYARRSEAAKRRGVSLRVSIESAPAGTAGGLVYVAEYLHDEFVLLNGDSWFDINLRDLTQVAGILPDSTITLALRSMPDAPRYGVVQLVEHRVITFDERARHAGPACVNAGVYVCRRDPLMAIITEMYVDKSGKLSLESEILPCLAERDALTGKVFSGYFIDIGVPASYQDAQTHIGRHRKRGAVFLDLDVITRSDHGVIDKVQLISGAQEVIRFCNDSGLFVFGVKDSVGNTNGYCSEGNKKELYQLLQCYLSKSGAHIDDILFFPMEKQLVPSEDEILFGRAEEAVDILDDRTYRWDIDVATSFLVGKFENRFADYLSGVRLHGFSGGSLLGCIRRCEPDFFDRTSAYD